jgi:Flp pilus assembly protein TadG
MCRAKGARRRPQHGAAAVEFALIMIPFLLLVFGLIQYGFYFYSAQSGSSAANAAARMVSVGNCQSDAALTAYVSKQLGAADKAGTLAVSRTYKMSDGTTTPSAPQPANVDVGGKVSITVTFQTLNMHFPFLPFLKDATVSRTVSARVEDTTERGCS